MSETLKTVPVEELLSTLAKIETVGDIGLEEALGKIGYEVTSDFRGNSRWFWFRASNVYNPNQVPTVTLFLSEGGVFDLKKDKNKLTDIKVYDSEKKVGFFFQNVDTEERHLTQLVTEHKIQER